MIVDIYAASFRNDDGLYYAVVHVDNNDILYTLIQSVGSEPSDESNAQILALDYALTLAARLRFADAKVAVFHTLDKVVNEDGSIVPGNMNSDTERFYCVLEMSVLTKLEDFDKSGRPMDLIAVQEDENLALYSFIHTDLGAYVDVDDLQIFNDDLAASYLQAIEQ